MAQRGETEGSSDISLIRSARSYRATTSESSRNSGIMEVRTSDSEDEFDVSAVTASIHSDLQTPPQMISGRGALISGMAVPSMDSDEEIQYDGDDLENGPAPPDSDYASHVPPQLFSKTIQLQKNEPNLASLAVDPYMKRHSVTETSDGLEQVNEDYSSVDSIKVRRSKRFWYCIIVTSLIFIGATIALAIVLSGSDEMLSPRQQEINDICVSISGQELIDDMYSPQRKAQKWIVYEDNEFKNSNEPLNRDAVVQRYVLAILYYATNGPLWTDNNWLKGGECRDEWTGIKCNNQNQILSLFLGNYKVCFRRLVFSVFAANTILTNEHFFYLALILDD
jgi:hypothetical protein